MDVQPELVNNNFNDEKESLISRWRNANDNSSNKKKTKSDLNVWSRWTGKNELNCFTKNTKCSNTNWLPFISPKKADYKCLIQDQMPDQMQFNWMETCMCMCVRKRQENEVTHMPNCSQSQSWMKEPVFYWYGNKTTSSVNKIEQFLCEWRKIET